MAGTGVSFLFTYASGQVNSETKRGGRRLLAMLALHRGFYFELASMGLSIGK